MQMGYFLKLLPRNWLFSHFCAEKVPPKSPKNQGPRDRMQGAQNAYPIINYSRVPASADGGSAEGTGAKSSRARVAGAAGMGWFSAAMRITGNSFPSANGSPEGLRRAIFVMPGKLWPVRKTPPKIKI